MPVRLACPDDAEILWEIRNQAIRHGCKNTYGIDIVMAWTPDQMPPGYRKAIAENPFYVAEAHGLGTPAATGYLESRGFKEIILSSTPNAFEFYKRNGFSLVKEGLYRSEMANADLHCMEMRCAL